MAKPTRSCSLPISTATGEGGARRPRARVRGHAGHEGESVPDPNAKETFDMSKLDWKKRESEEGKAADANARTAGAASAASGAAAGDRRRRRGQGAENGGRLPRRHWTFPRGTLSMALNIGEKTQPLPDLPGETLFAAAGGRCAAAEFDYRPPGFWRRNVKIPTATYRIQFRNGMTFDRAAALVPYLKRLGISHLYASPILPRRRSPLTATMSPTPTRSTRYRRSRRLRPHGENAEGGWTRPDSGHRAESYGRLAGERPVARRDRAWRKSRYARHFDINWSRRLTLPFLGDTFEAVLENGEISVKADPKTGKPAFAYYDSYYPLTPESWQGREEEVLKLTDKAQIAALHEQQPWRLMSGAMRRATSPTAAF